MQIRQLGRPAAAAAAVVVATAATATAAAVVVAAVAKLLIPLGRLFLARVGGLGCCLSTV